MSRNTLFLTVAIVLAVGLVLGGGGCGRKEGGAAGRQISEQTAPKAPDNARTVTMNGRSVMEGWMKHWGFKWEGAVEKNGYLLDYKELDGNDIAGSFARNTEGLAPGSVAFFKFCFVDFDGSNLQQREKEVEKVIQTASERGLKLVIGNALPVRKQDGTPEMLDEYKQYNAFLLQKAAGSQGVWIYDFYGVLTGPDGWLKPEYQTEDSHPNDEAYSALDPSFFELLGTAFAGQGK
jgi:hypothetical protein